MVFLRKSRKGTGLLTKQAYTFGFAVVILIWAGSAVHAPAQLKAPAAEPPKAEPTAKLDPLGRETPRRALMGFLTHEQRGDFATGARYFQLPPGKKTDLVQLAKELRVLAPNFKGDINLLSDDPDGELDPGLPPGQVRAGVIKVGGVTADVILVRVDDPVAGKIWLLSQQSLESIPKLYALVVAKPPTPADRFRTAIRGGPQLLGMSSRQWLGWVLSIPASWVLAWLLTFLISAPRRALYKIRKLPFRTVWETPIGMPLRCMIATLLHGFFVYMLQPPLLYRAYYGRFLAALLAGCFAWFASRLSDQGFNVALDRTRTRSKGGESILILMQKLNRVGIFIIAAVVALAFLGLNVSAALTGLGIGGLAVALGAQKTLDNLIGGVSLLMDKALQVGDFCKIGDRLGTVADIGLRSIKLRTLDQNLLVVPNGMLAQMQFENMKARPKLLISQNFSLRIETKIDQLRFVLDSVQTMLNEEPAIESGTSRVRVTSFAGAAYDLELFAYGKTSDWTELTAIRQDVVLKIAGIVEAAGTQFAAPTRLTYLSREVGIDAEKPSDVLRRVTEPKASDAFQVPEEARTGTK
jgi:MscS family membrane protein